MRRKVVKGPVGIIAAAMGAGVAIFQFYTAGFGVLPPREQRSVHLLFLLPLAFLYYPARKKSNQEKATTVDIILAVLAMAVGVYILTQRNRLLMRWEHVSPVLILDMVFGGIAVALVVEATRRAVSPAFAIVAGICLMYLPVASRMPVVLRGHSFSFPRIIELSYLLTDEGIYGVMTGISATFIFLFILFGAFVLTLGAGDFFIKLATAVAGRARGGPAKMAVLASGLFGMISGVATANVYVTGSFTIPLMKKIGYRKEFAGAVEAAASTGGQYMPPVMGAGAFIMAAMLGIPYLSVIKAALAAAVLYFIAVGLMVHWEALKTGLVGIPKEQIPKIRTILPQSYMIVPVMTLIYYLVRGYSPLRAGYNAILVMVAVFILGSIFDKNKKIADVPMKLLRTFEMAGKNAVVIAIACACAGLVISTMAHTGLGLAFTSLIIKVGGGHLPLVLLLTATGCIILGMGMPTSAAYILTAVLAAGAMTRLGVDPLATHLYIFYFAILGSVTPPVCITAYAAAGVAESRPLMTGFQAVRLSVVAYLAPVIFVYNRALLLQGSLMQIIATLSISVIAIFFLTAGLEGYLWRKMGYLGKMGCIAVALVLIYFTITFLPSL